MVEHMELHDGKHSSTATACSDTQFSVKRIDGSIEIPDPYLECVNRRSFV